MADSLGTPLSFAAKRLGDGQLLIVATNGRADKALKAYRKRWQIECLFGDSKTRGLNMEDFPHTSCQDRRAANDRVRCCGWLLHRHRDVPHCAGYSRTANVAYWRWSQRVDATL